MTTANARPCVLPHPRSKRIRPAGHSVTARILRSVPELRISHVTISSPKTMNALSMYSGVTHSKLADTPMTFRTLAKSITPVLPMESITHTAPKSFMMYILSESMVADASATRPGLDRLVGTTPAIPSPADLQGSAHSCCPALHAASEDPGVPDVGKTLSMEHVEAMSYPLPEHAHVEPADRSPS